MRIVPRKRIRRGFQAPTKPSRNSAPAANRGATDAKIKSKLNIEDDKFFEGSIIGQRAKKNFE